jgi:tetratricopeptide (TPR) repeat protein
MRAYVFTSKSLERYAGRFVWLSVNTEEPKNAEFLAKYPIPALPTLLVLDSRGESIVSRYVGGATALQLSRLLDDSLARSKLPADALVGEADKLASDGKHADAVERYEAALAKAPKGWPRYGRTAESLLFSLSAIPDNERCATTAVRLLPRLDRTVSGASVAASGLGCAADLEETNPRRGELLTALERATRAALDDSKLDLSGDDRSGLYMALISGREAVKDAEGAKRLRQDWSAFLDRSAASAKTPEQRAVYDAHRLSAYLDVGTPAKAVPMLEQSERDFPDDYNPPARLALAYRAMKLYDDALAASDRAVARAYGPRKLLILRQRSEIYLAKGDKEAAKKTVAEAITYSKSLPKEQVRATTLASLEKKLDELSR